MAQFVTVAVIVLLMIALFESDVCFSGGLAGEAQTEFLITAVMELLTLGAAFLALRLFKFGSVRADLLSRREVALLKWGVTRMMLIQAPLLLDTLLYYMYMKPTFGYLAIILVLCLPFVWPSMGRCIAETTPDEETPQQTV